MTTAVPVLPVSDLTRAVEFYESLGFEVEALYDEYATLRFSGAEVHLVRMDGIDARNTMSGAYLRVDDVVDVHRRWIGAGAREIQPVEAQPYGITEFATEDLDGNLWRVGSPT